MGKKIERAFVDDEVKEDFTDVTETAEIIKPSIKDIAADTANPVFKIEESQFNLELKKNFFYTVNDYKYFIKAVEKMVRTAPEYRNWTKYLRTEMNVTECVLTHETNEECSIEIHHHPISLFNVCCMVTDTLMQEKEKFSTFDVAQIVIGLHFADKVGYVPLVKTLHEKYHNGFLDIPIELIRGEWKFLTQNLNMSPDIQIVVNKLSEIGIEHASESWLKGAYKPDPDQLLIEDKPEEDPDAGNK